MSLLSSLLFYWWNLSKRNLWFETAHCTQPDTEKRWVFDGPTVVKHGCSVNSGCPWLSKSTKNMGLIKQFPNLRGNCTPDQFCDCSCIFFKITHWWQVRYVLVGNILRNLATAMEFHYCNGISLTHVVLDLFTKTWKMLIFTYCLQ